MNGFDKLINFFENKNYGDLVMPFFELIAIISGLLFARKDKSAIFFLGYLIFDFIIALWAIYIEVFSSCTIAERYLFAGFTNSLISLVELLVYFHFFSKILNNRSVIKLLRIFAVIFIVTLLVATKISFLTDRYFYVTNVIGAIEFLFVIVPCFVFFFELFQNNSTINLYERPSFWIVTGIFSYAVISIPYYLIMRFVASNQTNSWPFTYLLFFSIPFTLNFIFLTRAFLCKKTLTI